MAKAAKITIAEVEEIVPAGQLSPEEIHLPGIYVHRLFKGTNYKKTIEMPTFVNDDGTLDMPWTGEEAKARKTIAARAAQFIEDGTYINLGIGIPTLVPNYIPKDYSVIFQSENGILGLGGYPKRGEEDPDLINAGKESVKVAPGASYFGSSDSFLMIRGHHIDMTCLGALQVS